MKSGKLFVYAFIAISASAAGAHLTPTSSVAANIDVNTTLQQRLAAKYSNEQLFPLVMGSALPRGTSFSHVAFKGNLLGTGIRYIVPGDGIPPVPEVGDMADIRNCGVTSISRDVTLSSTSGESSNWSVTTGFSTTVGQEYTVGAEFEAGSRVFGGTLSGSAEMKTSWEINSSQDFNRGKEEHREKSYSTTVSISIAPDKLYKLQLMSSTAVAEDVPFTATFRANGNTDIHFRSPVGGNKVCFVTDQGKFLTAEDDQETVTWGKRNRTQCASWEQFVIEDENGGELLSGDHVYVRTNFNRYWSARDDGDLTADRAEKKSWERFILSKVSGSAGSLIVSGDKVSFLGEHGDYVVADDDNVVRANRGTRGPWETFAVKLVSADPVKSVNIETLLSETEREVEFMGKYNGSFTAHQQNIWATDYDITAECEQDRQHFTGTSTPTTARAAAKTLDIGKLEKVGLVSVTKASTEVLKNAKPIDKEPHAYELKAKWK